VLTMNTGLIAFTVALITSLGLTVPVRQLALRVGMVDRPGPRKVHLQPIPLLGGLAIYCGVLIALLVSMDGPALIQVLGVYSGATLVACRHPGRPRAAASQIKLFGAMPAAAVILLATGIRGRFFLVLAGDRCPLGRYGAHFGVGRRHHRVLQHSGPHGWTLRRNRGPWRRSSFAIFALRSGQILVSTMAAAVLGAAAGFLRWNFKPAKIFMGMAARCFLVS